MKLNTKELSDAIRLCFAKARDTKNFSAKQRQQMLFRGKILRGHLVNLISASWDPNANPALLAANKRLAKINKRLKSTKRTLEKFANTIKQIGNLIKNLEKLLALAASFV